MPKEKPNLKNDFIEYTEKLRLLLFKASNNLPLSDSEKGYTNVYERFYKRGISGIFSKTLDIDNGSHFIDIIYRIGTPEAIKNFVEYSFIEDPKERAAFFALPEVEQIKKLNVLLPEKIKDKSFIGGIIPRIERFFLSESDIYENGFQKKIIDTVEQITGASSDKFIPKKSLYANPFDLSLEENEIYPLSNQIDEAIQEVTSINDNHLNNKKDVILNALEESKNVMSFGNEFSIENGLRVAEGVGLSYEVDFKKKLSEDYEKDPLIRGKFDTSTRVGLKINTKLEDTIEIHKDLPKRSLSGCFTDEQIKEFENLYNLMDKNNLIPSNIDEQGIKNYCFLPLYETKEHLSDSIKNKEYDDVVKYLNEYKEKEKCFDKMLLSVKKLNSEGRLISNLNVSRNEFLPYKYRSDFINVSNLNGISLMFSWLKNSNVSIKDFLENPIKHYGKLNDYFFDNQPGINDFKNSSKKQMLLDSMGANNEYQGAKKYKFNLSTLGFYRAINTMRVFIHDEADRREFAKDMNALVDISTQQHLEASVSAINSLFDADYRNNRMNRINKLVAILSYEKDKDGLFDISLGSDKKYDRKSYKEYAPFNLADRAQKMKNVPNFLLEAIDSQKFLKDQRINDEDYENFVMAFRILDNAIPANRKSATYLRISECVVKNQLNNIKTEDIDNLKAEASFENYRKNGFTRETFAEGLLIAAKMKKTYENAGFFEKIFNFTTGQKKTISDDIVNKLAESGGLTKNEINDAIELINSGLDDAIDLVKPNIKINHPGVDSKYVEYKLKGASEKELEMLFESPVLLDKKEREKFEGDLELEEASIEGRIASLDSEIKKARNFGNRKDEYSEKAIQEYKNVSLEKAIINKRLGIATDFSNDVFPLTPEEKERYDNVVLGEKISKRDEIANKKFVCVRKEDNVKVEKTLFELYNEICKINSINNSAITKKPFDKVLSCIRKDQDLLTKKIGLSDDELTRFVPNLKKLKAFDESIAKDKYDVSVLGTKQGQLINKIMDTDTYAQEKEAALAKIQPLMDAKGDAFNALNVFQEKKNKFYKFNNLISNLNDRKRDNGEDIENDVVAEYQRKIIAFNKLNPKQKEKYRAAGKEIEDYKNSFRILDIQTDGFNFTKKEQQIYSANKNKVVELHNSKKAYESTSIVARFFSHFVPASWTDLGNARLQIENKQKEINDLGLSNEVIKHYESTIELENKTNNNIAAENNKPVNANQEQKEIQKNRVIFNGEIDLKFSDSSYIEKTSQENKTLSSQKENKF